MDRVIIGVDPHRKSVTFEARDGREILRATGLRYRAGPQDDATDAHVIVMVALRDKGLREVSSDPELAVLKF